MSAETAISKIVYFSKMAQGVPSLGPVQRLTGGAFISNRARTLRFFTANFPGQRGIRYGKFMRRLRSAHRELQRAEVIVSGAVHASVLGDYDAIRAMIFHGTYRALSRQQILQMKGFDHVFLNGPRMKRMLKRYPEDYNFTSEVSGYVPFADFPEKTPENRKRILEKLGVNPDRKLIFYAPARRDCGSWVECAEEIAAGVPADCSLVMRPHPNQALHGKSNEKALYHRVNHILEDRGTGRVDLAICSFPELMSVADLLISDATSPTEEYMFYGGPQIITETFSRDQWREVYEQDGMHPTDVDELMGLYDCAHSYARGDFTDWRQAMETALGNPDEHAARQRDYFESAFGPDPKGAAQRVADGLLKLLGGSK